MSFAPSQLKQRLLKGLGANAYGQLVTIGIQLLSVPLFLYYWGAEQYGEWLILAAIPAYLSLSDIGFATVAGNQMAMQMAKDERQAALITYQSSWAFITAVSTFILFAIAAVLLALPVAQLFNLSKIVPHDAALVLLCLGIQVLVSLQGGMVSAGYRAMGEYATGAFFTNSIRLFEWVLGAVTLSLGYGPVEVALAILIGRISSTLLSMIFLQKRAPWLNIGFKHIDKSVIRSLIKPAFSFMAFPLGQALSIQGVTIIIGSFLGPTAVVVFSTYRTLSRLLVQAVTLVNQALWPEISAAYGAENMKLVQMLHRKGFSLSFWFGIFAVIFIGFFGNTLIEFWTHKALAENNLLLWLLLSVAFINITWQSSWVVLMAINKHSKISFIFLMSSATSLLILFIFNRFYGVEFSALVLAIAELPLLFYTISQAIVLTKDQPLLFLKSINLNTLKN